VAQGPIASDVDERSQCAVEALDPFEAGAHAPGDTTRWHVIDPSPSGHLVARYLSLHSLRHANGSRKDRAVD
jgi:hypothetical protein